MSQLLPARRVSGLLLQKDQGQDDLNLLAGASGIRIGSITNKQVGGGGWSFGPDVWIKCTMAVTTLEGKEIGNPGV